MSTPKKILLIDDDDAIIAFLEPRLAKFYTVIATTDPHRAIKLAQSEAPDLVICDVDMPEMDGGDLAAVLSEDTRTRNIPLLFLTALISPAEAKELGGKVAKRPGVAKRAPLPELLEKIKELIGG